MQQDTRKRVAVSEPDEPAVPLIYSSAHSGRGFPKSFAPSVPERDLLGYEDRFVDDLVADAPRTGIALVAALFPRAFIDPNRSPDDLDEHIVDESFTGQRAPSVYSERGIGLVFRSLPSGKAIYDRPLGHADLVERMDGYWRPFHDVLARRLDIAVERWGRVWHIDWHSMRPVGDALSPDPGVARPDFVVGNRDGRSAAPEVTEAVVEALRRRGFAVAINEPFKGGYITERYGAPDRGCHTVQIEINRGLYLDMDTLEASQGFAPLRAALHAVSQDLAAALRTTD